MEVHRKRWWRRRWSPPLLLSMLALAYACAALVCVCALREAPFELMSDSEYASALADDALGLDDDDADDDDDPVAFTLEAAQKEAARLLSSFSEAVFLPDDGGDEDDDEDEFDSGVENALVEKEGRDDVDLEVASDANVRRTTIKLHRSDATVVDADGDADSSASGDAGVSQSEAAVVDAGDDDGADMDHDADSDANADNDNNADASVESDGEGDFDDNFFDDATDEQVEPEHSETEAEPEEAGDLVYRPNAVAQEEEEEEEDEKQRQPAEETSDDDDAVGQGPSRISKRVGAVFLKVRGVIFPNSKADDKSNEVAIADIKMKESATQVVIPVMPSSDDEDLIDVHGDQEGAPSSSYKEKIAAVEQTSSFLYTELSRDPAEIERGGSSDLAGTEESDLEGDASSFGNTETTQEAVDSTSFESTDVFTEEAENERNGDDSSDFERNEHEEFKVEFKSEAEGSPFPSSDNEDLSVDVSVDDAEYAEDEIEEAVAVAVVSALCETDPASDASTCEPQQSIDSILASEHVSTSENDEPIVSFQEIVLEMATAAEQIVDALSQGRYPHVPAAFSRARAKSRAKLDAWVKAVKDPVQGAILILVEYFAVAKAEASAGLDIVLIHLNTLYDYMGRTASIWIQHMRSVYRQVSQWCWEVWSTYEEVRILGRNVFGLALLLPCGLLFSSLYRVVAAVPEFLCTYFLTFDEVTRAQLKIFSVVLLMVFVYHARVLAWFWILLSAALGYYYWSGHVVISVKFK